MSGEPSRSRWDSDDVEEDKEEEALRMGSSAACWASISRRACSRIDRMASSDPLPPCAPPVPPPPPPFRPAYDG